VVGVPLSQRLGVPVADKHPAGNYQGVWPINHAIWQWSVDQSAYAATGMPRKMLFDLVGLGVQLGVVAAQAAVATGIPVQYTLAAY